MISIAFVVGAIATVLGLVVCVGLLIYSRRTDSAGLSLGAAGGGLVILLASAYFFFPYKAEYHYYAKTTGTVEEAKGRLLAGGNNQAPTENFAVRFRGSEQIYRCDDSRCALAKPGDKITLYCIKDWQWVGESGYVCRYGS